MWIMQHKQNALLNGSSRARARKFQKRVIASIAILILLLLTGVAVWYLLTDNQTSNEVSIKGVLRNITDCVGTPESSPQCGYVLVSSDKSYSLQGAAAQPYISSRDAGYIGKTFAVKGELITGGKNQFGQPVPDIIKVTSMHPE